MTLSRQYKYTDTVTNHPANQPTNQPSNQPTPRNRILLETVVNELV